MPLFVLHGLHHSYIFTIVYIILCSQYFLYIILIYWQVSFLSYPSWYLPIFCICTSKELQGICLFEGYSELSNNLSWVEGFFVCVGKKDLEGGIIFLKRISTVIRELTIFLVPKIMKSSTTLKYISYDDCPLTTTSKKNKVLFENM